MTKPLVERYEQILAQDPTSTAFVEFAKALLAKGDFARAIEVCQQGLSHHKGSVVGRVLWGKALLQLSKPAEAMEQFDQAIAIDRDNPHAYNLIGEVLLHKGLYRSALPILRKAVALQPQDGRVRQWLEQTQRSLAGQGPAPVVSDPTLPEADAANEPDNLPLPPSLPPEEPSKLDSAPLEDATEDAAPAPANPTATVPSLPELTDPHGLSSSVQEEDEESGVGETTDPMGATAVPVPGPGANPPPKPLATVKTLPSFEALMGATPPTDAEHPLLALSDEDAASMETTTPGMPIDLPGVTQDGPSVTSVLPTVTLSKELKAHLAGSDAALASPSRTNLLEDVSVLEDDVESGEDHGPLPLLTPRVPTGIRQAVPRPLSRPPPLSSSGSKRMLLTDLPEQPDGEELELPKVELSQGAAQALAQEYERELREKLLEKTRSEDASFFARHWRTAAFVGVALLVIGVGTAAYLQTRAANRGRDLASAMATAKRNIAQDTPHSYREAIDALQVSTRMAPSNAEAWALMAQALALLVDEHKGTAEDRARAQEALGKPGVETSFPAIALVARYHLASGNARAPLSVEVLKSKLEHPELHVLVGQLLATKGDSKGALEHFKQARDAAPSNVRALVALGDTYREMGDCGRALGFYSTAGQVSPFHTARVVGAAECRLELRVELNQGLKDLEALDKDGSREAEDKADSTPTELRAREVLARGRLLSALGNYGEATQRLKAGAQAFGTSHAFDFNLALGEALRGQGNWAAAQAALEAAVKARPKSEDARAALGRVQVGRDREKDAYSQLEGLDGRKSALIRGIALTRLGDPRRARAELVKTQINGKYPSEAVAYLALADLAEGNEDRAVEPLEHAVTKTRVKTDVRVALGQIYRKKGAVDKARIQFAEAMKDSLDYEGACALGRLLLSRDSVEAAVGPLAESLQRNPSHGEARRALAETYLRLGKTTEAMKQAESWQGDNPSSPDAQRGLARILHLIGRDKDAESASARAVTLDDAAPESYRLRADILFSLGQGSEAMKALEAANKRDPKDPETFCAIGRAFVRQGKTQNAVKAYEAALKQDEQSLCGRIGVQAVRLPSNARSVARELAELSRTAQGLEEREQAQVALARALLAAGNLAEARKAAEAAVKLSPQSGEAHLALGQVAVRQRDDTVARAALSKAVEREPAYAAAHLAFADLLNHSDADLEHARKEYEAFLQHGGEPSEQARVKRTLSTLKKRLATR